MNSGDWLTSTEGTKHREQLKNSEIFVKRGKQLELLEILIKAKIESRMLKLSEVTAKYYGISLDQVDHGKETNVSHRRGELTEGLDAFYRSEGRDSSVRLSISTDSYRLVISPQAVAAVIEGPTEGSGATATQAMADGGTADPSTETAPRNDVNEPDGEPVGAGADVAAEPAPNAITPVNSAAPTRRFLLRWYAILGAILIIIFLAWYGMRMQISEPLNNASVSTTAAIRGSGINPFSYQYIAVSPSSDPAIVFIQSCGTLSQNYTNLLKWKCDAYFGKRETPDGTGFDVFVLSTNAPLKATRDYDTEYRLINRDGVSLSSDSVHVILKK